MPSAVAIQPERWPIVDVVIPAFNERDSLPLVLADLPRDRVREVIVVDNGSTDGTAEGARRAGATTVLEPKRCFGSRALGSCERGALLPQARWGNRLAAWLIRRLYGMHVTDLGPFRAIRFSTLQALEMSDLDFGWTAEMQVKAARSGARYCEVPVSYRRRVGVSKISGTLPGTLRAGTKILYTIFRHRLG